MHKAVFLDRDGVINVDHGYVYRFEDFAFIDGVVESLARLRSLGFLLVLVTNQSGIARGMYTEEDFDLLCARMQEVLAESRAQFDRIYYCPHLKEGSVTKYKIDCQCRKPRPGMFLQAISELGIDAGGSYMVGDRPSDLEAARKAGVRTLIYVGDNAETIQSDKEGVIFYKDLHDFVFNHNFG